MNTTNHFRLSSDFNRTSKKESEDFLNKLKNQKEKINEIMKLSDEKAIFLRQNTGLTTDNPNVKSQDTNKKNKVNIFKKIKNYFKNLFFKYFIEPELNRIAQEAMEKELARKEAIKNEIIKNFYNTTAEERTKYNNALIRIRKESAGKTTSNIPMFFDPDAVFNHNSNPDRITSPALSEIVKYENERATKVLNQQGDPNFTKKKIDLMMKKRISIDDIK